MLKLCINIFLLLAVWSLAQGQTKSEKKIRKNFQKILKKEDVHNGFLQIKSADGTIDWKYAEGQFQDGMPVTEFNPFHSASVGKMLTATAILQLTEDGQLGLNDPVSEHLPGDVVKGLHVFEGVDYSGKITISQLLQHTSGLPDYIEDSPKNGSPGMMTLLFENPDKFWEIDELLTFSKKNLEAHFPPGEGYHYTDTEYLLLGLIVEEIHGKELHEVFREEFFEPLEMKHSSMYKRSASISAGGRMAEFYVDETEISQYQSLSLDWAGGGLVTTTEDLLKFHQALMSNDIITESSLEKMQDWINESKATYYGLGLRKYEFKEFSKLLPDLTIIGHSGVNSSFCFYCPELNVYVAGTFNQTNHTKTSIQFLMKVLMALRNEKLKYADL
jgi:CubicO group peptidase (beta-lactamase class C family)